MADQNRNEERGAVRREDAGATSSRAEGRRNPADNLTREARVRGGERSAKMQQRDARGQFSGRKHESEKRGETRSPNAGRSAGEPASDNR
jgi:hypothetical protein